VRYTGLKNLDKNSGSVVSKSGKIKNFKTLTVRRKLYIFFWKIKFYILSNKNRN